MFLCAISGHRLHTETRYLTACLRGGQLADREERTDGCDHLCFCLESLIQPLSNFPYFQSCPPYSVEVDEVALVVGTTEEGAVVASERLPGSMEVIGHYIDEVQLPDGGVRVLMFKKIVCPEIQF